MSSSILYSILQAAGFTMFFSFHGRNGYTGDLRDDSIIDRSKFPRLESGKIFSWSSITHISCVTLPILAGTYYWGKIRAESNKIIGKNIGLRCCSGLGILIIFDLFSWYERLRYYGPRRVYGLDENDIPTTIKRPQSDKEILWMRTNQIILPSTLCFIGNLTGFAPFLFVPVITWKCFLHYWVLFQDDEIRKLVGKGHMDPYRELIQTKGYQYALEIYCSQKNIKSSDASKRLFEMDLSQ